MHRGVILHTEGVRFQRRFANGIAHLLRQYQKYVPPFTNVIIFTAIAPQCDHFIN